MTVTRAGLNLLHGLDLPWGESPDEKNIRRCRPCRRVLRGEQRSERRLRKRSGAGTGSRPSTPRSRPRRTPAIGTDINLVGPRLGGQKNPGEAYARREDPTRSDTATSRLNGTAQRPSPRPSSSAARHTPPPDEGKLK